MIKIQCPSCKFEIPLDQEESLYENYLLCLCNNLFPNPNFIGNKQLNEYLNTKNG